MFIKYVYDHNNDVWIIKVGDDSYYLTGSGPKMVKKRYDIIILCCKVFLDQINEICTKKGLF